MKWVVMFGKPYFQATIEEGVDEKYCVRQALAKFNKEFITGTDDLDDVIYSNAEKNAERHFTTSYWDKDERFSLNEYEWEILVYDNNTIKNATDTLRQILSDIKAETIKKTNELIKKNKLEQYKKLKEELEIK